jgi:hypothetical protein
MRPLSAMTAVGTFPAHLEPEVERNLQRLIGVVVQRKGDRRRCERSAAPLRVVQPKTGVLRYQLRGIDVFFRESDMALSFA